MYDQILPRIVKDQGLIVALFVPLADDISQLPEG